jgi:processive 1,2-diacylglycerol beta-glucosyltransferase
MVKLYDAEKGTRLGDITEEDLRFLIEQLEEESLTDRDYYVSADTVDMLEQAGGDPTLIATLRQALGGGEGVEVRWERW